MDRCRQVIDLESNVWNGLHQVRNQCTVPVPLPLDAERIVVVIAYRYLQMRQRNFAIEMGSRWYPTWLYFIGKVAPASRVACSLTQAANDR